MGFNSGTRGGLPECSPCCERLASSPGGVLSPKGGGTDREAAPLPAGGTESRGRRGPLHQLWAPRLPTGRAAVSPIDHEAMHLPPER